MRPLLDDLELPQVQEIATHDRRMLSEHKPAGMEGSLLQNLGRQPTRLVLWGVAAGSEALDFVDKLDGKFRAGKPVLFVADIVKDSQIEQMAIDDLRIQELAGKPERYAYVLTLREFIPPPQREEVGSPVNATVQQEGQQLTNQQVEDITRNEGGLRIQVELEDDSQDYTGVVVLVEGNSESGERLTFTLEEQVGGIYSRDDVPAGDYDVQVFRS